jgi:hypothetical protein
MLDQGVHQVVTELSIARRFPIKSANAASNAACAVAISGAVTRNGVVSCLNRHYYGLTSDTEHSFLIGSRRKDTAVRPPRDVDLYFLLPPDVYGRFQGHLWNRQSALLQEVKDILSDRYPNTDMSGDGQVVLVRFETYSVEVVPAFSSPTVVTGYATPVTAAPTRRRIPGPRLAISTRSIRPTIGICGP